MDSADHRIPDGHTGDICPLEWVTLATDAARTLAERDDTGRFRLDYTQLYNDKLTGL